MFGTDERRRRIVLLRHAAAGALLHAVMLLICASATSAQETRPAAEEPSAPKPEPVEAIPVAEIGVASERSKRALSDITKTLDPSDDVAAAAASLPQLREGVRDQLEKSQRIRAGGDSIVDLDQLEREWRAIRDGLTGVQALLSERGKQIEKGIAQIRKERARWKATREIVLSREADPHVVRQIDEVDQACAVALTKANERQAFVLGVQSDVAALSLEVESEIESIRGVRNELVGEVLNRDALPIWSSDFWRMLDVRRIGDRLSAHRVREEGMLRSFWTSHRGGITAYLVITLLAVICTVVLKPQIHARLEEEDLAPVRAIFDRPIALSLLVAFFIGIFLSGEARRVLAPVLGAATLVPAVLILRNIVDRPLFPLLNAVMGVFFLHQLGPLIAPLPSLHRLAFLAEMSIPFLLAAYWLNPSRLRSVPPEMTRSRLFRIVGYGLRAVFVLAFVAMAANVAGYQALATMVGDTLVWSSWVSVVLYGTVRVADGILAFLLRVRPLRLLGMVRHNRWLLRRRAGLLIGALGWYLWATTTLRRAEVLDDVQADLAAVLTWKLPLPEVELTLGDVAACALTLYVATLLSRLLRFVLDEDVYPRVRLAKGRPYAISTLLHYVILIIGFLLATAALGFDLNRFTLLAGAFGVGIGFGMQNIVNNFISGIILLTERPVEVGDTIALADVFGDVQRIGIRSSTVRTWQGAEVIVPNAELISQQVTNWTLSDRRRRMEIPVGVAYGTDPLRVQEILLRVAKEGESVLPEPAPVVLFMGFGESSLDFEVRAWTDQFERFLGVRSALCCRIAEALREADITIPFPQRDLHVRSVAGQAPPAGEEEQPATPTAIAGEGRDDLDEDAARPPDRERRADRV